MKIYKGTPPDQMFYVYHKDVCGSKRVLVHIFNIHQIQFIHMTPENAISFGKALLEAGMKALPKNTIQD